ncbi:MAG: hypothetical protein M1812_000290 [Candelaria pacifica]|nr:MAG: hypothetical protein M1812_000290 [Candelaria pacifica]
MDMADVNAVRQTLTALAIMHSCIKPPPGRAEHPKTADRGSGDWQIAEKFEGVNQKILVSLYEASYDYSQATKNRGGSGEGTSLTKDARHPDPSQFGPSDWTKFWMTTGEADLATAAKEATTMGQWLLRLGA